VINKFIAMPSASHTKQLAIIDKLEPYPLLVLMLPNVEELPQGKS
jgi:hypothetical protein